MTLLKDVVLVAKLLIIPQQYDLCITYSWRPGTVRGITGHLYECLEYYVILNKHIRSCILIGSGLDKTIIRNAIASKYNFTVEEINCMMDDIIISNDHTVVKGNKCLFVDGNFSYVTPKNNLLFKQIYAFVCSDKSYEQYDNIIALQDDRVYNKGKNTTNYIKKILFSRYKQHSPDHCKFDNVLYVSNIRSIERSVFEQIGKDIEGSFLVITDSDTPLELPQRFFVTAPPVDGLFTQFHTYVYTPVSRKLDCSSRFIAECAFYGKNVIYYNVDYWDQDLALSVRVDDTIHNLPSLFLSENDDIINIIT